MCHRGLAVVRILPEERPSTRMLGGSSSHMPRQQCWWCDELPQLPREERGGKVIFFFRKSELVTRN